MAYLFIQEYEELVTDGKGQMVPVGREPAVATQRVTFTTSTASTAFNARTKFIRVTGDAAAYLAFGASPTATASSMLLPSGAVEYFGVTGGQKVAAYDGSS